MLGVVMDGVVIDGVVIDGVAGVVRVGRIAGEKDSVAKIDSTSSSSC